MWGLFSALVNENKAVLIRRTHEHAEETGAGNRKGKVFPFKEFKCLLTATWNQTKSLPFVVFLRLKFIVISFTVSFFLHSINPLLPPSPLLP